MEYRLVKNPNGMVSKEVFMEKMKELQMMFPTWKMDLSNNMVMKILYKHLGYCTDDKFSSSIDNYIKMSEKNPTVAGLQTLIKSFDGRSNYLKRLEPVLLDELGKKEGKVIGIEFRRADIYINLETNNVEIWNSATDETEILPISKADYIVKEVTDLV